MVESTVESTRRPKFEFADGLRAIAALSVATLHATTFTGHLGDADEQLPVIARLAELGNYAVPVFITLSGYVLMLPVARTANFELRGGFWKYIWRRAKRILPPYYAAIALFLLLIALAPALQSGHDTAWGNKVPITLEGIVSHILLVHIWNPDWVYQIDGPAWSVATEWHIYFLMPLLLLPLCRWFNPWVMLGAALALGPVLTFSLPGIGSDNYWMIGLFALGMIAALATVRGTRLPRRWIGVAAIAIAVLAAAWMLVSPPSSRPAQMVSDTVAGVAVALGLLALGRAAMEDRPSLSRKVLEWRPLVGLGLFSYSIYLIHSPILALANILLLPLQLPTIVNWLLLMFGALPVAIAAAYGFFLLVERHFITSHQKRALKS
ncbi:acyltransferase [Herbiconiux sp. VKM Ac-1786]|uniref:acyltransferase family protein n=1 Tax=Herbiconiux sp. VKM Ac-1786 TaxID=2783824 RepID=UPI00188D1829|nr:acyltransferase [Herbiconiux sp. VKM Ac-1786]MBF4572933.1 acyltransferase [Herbiconiux sp. VKM Ac-1786]